MKYLWAVIAAPITLLISLSRAEGHMPWRALMQILPNNETKDWSDEEKKSYRRKEYREVFIHWIIFTLGTFVYVFFFLD